MHETSNASRLTTWLATAFVFGTLSAAVVGAESPAGQSTSGPTVLSIAGPQFTLNGKPTFLLGISYYAGAGATERFLEQDLDDLQRCGFNWLRVWATWGAFQQDVSAVDVSEN